MAILGAVAAPTFFESLLFHRIESAARRVKADLELARTQARLTSSSRTVTFANSAYTISNTASLDNASQLYAVDLTEPPFSLDSAVANFSNNAFVTFDGYGTPTSGGTIVLTVKSHSATITLDGTSGNVTFTTSHPNGGSAAVPGS